MKTFKLIDVWGSIAIIVVFIVYAFFNLEGGFITGYFVAGGWQLISMIVHSSSNWFMKKGGSRRMYTNVVIVILAATVLGIAVFPVLGVVAVLMLFAAAPMAILYTAICYKEVYVKMERPLAILK